MSNTKPLTQRQKRIEEALGAYKLEESLHHSPDPSEIREHLRIAILHIRRAAQLMDELGCPWFDKLSK